MRLVDSILVAFVKSKEGTRNIYLFDQAKDSLYLKTRLGILFPIPYTKVTYEPPRVRYF